MPHKSVNKSTSAPFHTDQEKRDEKPDSPKSFQLLDLWPILAAFASAIMAVIFSPTLTDVQVAAYATLLAFLIFGWIFTTKNYWPGSVQGPQKFWFRFFLITVSLGLSLWILYASRPHFEMTALNTLEGDKNTYEVTDMLIWNADELAHFNTSGKLTFQVTPLYYGQRKYGEVYAIVRGDKQEKKIKLMDYLTKDTLPITFSLDLAEVLAISTIEEISSPKSNLLSDEKSWIPANQISIYFIVAGVRSFPWEEEKVTIRNAPWEQRSALVWRGDHYDVDLYVKNLGGKGEFTFRWYLSNINQEVDSSPYVTQNGTTPVDSGYEPSQMVTLDTDEVFSTTLSIDYPTDPGRYLVEVYPIKKQNYIEFFDPQFTWESLNIERPWWFMRSPDDLIFVVPAPEVPEIPIGQPIRAEIERLMSEENVDLGAPLGAAEEITSDHSGMQGQRQFFENGVIYVYNEQVYSIYGPVLDYFQAKFEDDDYITFPTSPIQVINPGTDREASIMAFEGTPPSEIIISKQTRGWIEGWVAQIYWEKYGGTDGWLGFPISSLMSFNDSDIQAFESGYIVFYHPEVDGVKIYDKEPKAFPYLASQGDLIGIHAELPWQETGVQVNEGDIVTIIEVGGEWTIDKNLGNWCHGEGMIFEKTTEWSITPLAPIGAMIGRIGKDDASIFPVGRWSKFTAPTDGMLYLTINDQNHQDNVGLISVEVIVEPED